MIVADFLMIDKANQDKFCKRTFLVANVSLKIVFKMHFFILNNEDVDFLNWKLGRMLLPLRMSF